MALDFAKFNAGLLNKTNKPSASFSKSNSTSSISSYNNVTSLSSNVDNVKYLLRPHIQAPTRFDPASTLSPNNNGVLSSSRHSNSKSTSRLF